MMKCILENAMEHFKGRLTAPGWWFLAPEGRLICVRRAGLRFVSTLYRSHDLRAGSPDAAGRSVIGSYPTVLDARKAAELLAAMEPDCERVARWSELAKQLTSDSIDEDGLE